MNRKEYIRNYQKNWLKKRRAEYFLNKSCINCGSKNNLELDHIDPSKKITHRIWSRCEQFRNEELSKCQILCEECHKQKTNNYCKELFTGKDLKKLQIFPNELFEKVIELNKEGLSFRKACDKVGIKYSTFSSSKSRKTRIFK